MVLTKHRPRHDEAVLLDATVHAAPAPRPRAAVGSQIPRDDVNLDDLPDPVAKEISFDDIAPEAAVVAPPARRRLNHDSVVAVLRELRAADAPPAPAEQIRHALVMATAPLASLLAAPTPRTDWIGALHELEQTTVQRLAEATNIIVRACDASANRLAFDAHQAGVQLAEVSAR